MRVFRDIFAAVMVGIMGGLLVTTISYYNKHKEGGITQTLLAVADSFYTVAEAYSDEEEDSLLAKLKDYDMEEQVLEAFEQVENGNAVSMSDAMLKSLLGNEADGGDILAMDGIDGGIAEGKPYSGIMRFHVRANSDSEKDQELKLAVKEDVVTMLKPLLEDCENVEESRNVIVSNLQNIYKTAVNTVVEQGYDYEVQVYVTEEEFPAKTYGELTFPAGEYQALRIDIGKAEGQNWWCVMYPPLCFIDESTAVVSEEGKELLKENLTAKEYADLFAHSKVKGESLLYKWLTGK
ncbi:MAG: stage II sporulation protein R [Ruminococcus flavefaciens]|nr:stage II sporulation protein R [Clostridium sp.]MCM1236687.1 stage II sporulation protein R [Ruminococcus flavefaciens]